MILGLEAWVELGLVPTERRGDQQIRHPTFIRVLFFHAVVALLAKSRRLSCNPCPPRDHALAQGTHLSKNLWCFAIQVGRQSPYSVTFVSMTGFFGPRRS